MSSGPPGRTLTLPLRPGLLRRTPAIVPAALLLCGLLALRCDAPWIFIHDDNGAWTQAVATAHLRAGLSRTRGQDFLLRRSDGALVPYLHHPPLFPLLMAGGYRLTGRSDELVTRALPAAFHVLGLLGMAVLAGALYPAARGLQAIALWIYALVPMSSFFGKMPFNEPVGLAGVVWGTALICAHRRRPAGWRLGAASAAWALACWASWPAYPILAAVVLVLFLDARLPHAHAAASRSGAVALAVVGALSLALVIGQLTWAAGGGLDPLLRAGGYWSAALTDPAETLRQLGATLDFHRRYFANVPFALMIAWCAVRIARLRHAASLPFSDRLVGAGLVAGALWALAFLRQVALHAYGQFWFLPFESLAAAEMTLTLGARLARRPHLRAGLAVAGALVTVISGAYVLHYRYTHVHGYAVRTAALLARTYESRP